MLLCKTAQVYIKPGKLAQVAYVRRGIPVPLHCALTIVRLKTHKEQIINHNLVPEVRVSEYSPQENSSMSLQFGQKDCNLKGWFDHILLVLVQGQVLVHYTFQILWPGKDASLTSVKLF